MAMRKPSPSAPIRRSPGIRQPSIRSSPVVEPLIPILGSIRPIENPGSVASTMNAVIPASARANTT